MAKSKVIIIGANGHEYAEIKTKNKRKRYFETKGQLYRVYPEGYVRMKIHGIDGDDDAEVIIYDENCIAPYDITPTMDYSADAFEEDIWIDKSMSSAYEKKHLSWQNVGSFMQQNSKYIPFVAIGIVVLFAFISQWLGQ